MPNLLTVQQLNDAQTMITRGDVVGFYNYMYSQGYGYANLAKGVVVCSLSSGGAIALQYMTDVAKQAGITLTTQQVAKIEIDMAKGYVNTLLSMAKSSGGTVSADINGDQALAFHNDVFDRNGLPRESWTLYTLSQYLSKEKFNADFYASIAPGANIFNSGGWAVDMVLAAQAYDTAQSIGFSSSQNAKAVTDINSWIVRVTQGTSAAVADAANLSDPIAGCQAGVQQTIKQIQQDAVNKQSQNSVTIPTDATTRVSANFITDTNVNDHFVVIKAGGSVWDAYVIQKNSANGITNWDEFKTAVSASNPNIADLKNVGAGTILYLPQKFADGSITYNYANGAAINTKTSTGEYLMTLPDGNGGQAVYQRIGNSAQGFIVRQSTTNAQGVTQSYIGIQNSIDGDIITASQSGNTVTASLDTNADGKADSLIVKTFTDNKLTKLSTESTTTYDYTSGKALTNANTYGSADGSVLFNTKLTSIDGNTTINQVTGIKNANGVITSATLSGNGASLNASSADITIAAGATNITLTGDGNKINLSAGSKVTINGSATLNYGNGKTQQVIGTNTVSFTDTGGLVMKDNSGTTYCDLNRDGNWDKYTNIAGLTRVLDGNLSAAQAAGITLKPNQFYIGGEYNTVQKAASVLGVEAW